MQLLTELFSKFPELLNKRSLVLKPNGQTNFIIVLNQVSFLLFIHVVQQFQTGATFSKRAFKVVLFSCLLQNSI